MARALRRTVLGTLLLVVVAAAAAYGGWLWLVARMEAPGPATEEVVVLLERGQGLRAIATTLEREGVIDDAVVFQIGARLMGRDRRLQAGEYAFAPGVSALGVLELLESGRTYRRRFTVQEGLTVQEVFRALEAEPHLSGELPELPPEGTLLPETYFYTRGDARAELVARMRESMRETLEELWEQRQDGLPFETPEEAVVLASIVEKETGVGEERAKVAGVFVNRLRRGMRLQSDPTTIYALTEGSGPLGRPLTRADLETPSPYNTYHVAGLPPAPIANPGRASREATLDPAEVPYYYFVADGSGGHAFARTLDEHNRNVRRWRQIQRNRETE
jgi:UPF0755 protein